MKVIDLTMHLYEGMPFGRMWPWERPFTIESPLNYETAGARLDNFTMFSEPGTRLVMPCHTAINKDDTKIDEVELPSIVLRDTVILDVPKGAEEAITPKDIDEAFDTVEFHPGDAVLLRTGWGDGERYYKLGDDYILKSPYYSDEGCKRLTERMTENNLDMFFYDTANMGMPKNLIRDWTLREPRPEGWPSDEAKAFLMEYASTPEKVAKDWGGVEPISQARVVIVGGIVNCGEITKPRVKLITLPLKVKGRCIAPARVIAVEE